MSHSEQAHGDRPSCKGPKAGLVQIGEPQAPRLLEKRGRASPGPAPYRRVSRRIAFRLWPAARNYAA